MAGDWIKMRADLRSDPAVFKLAALTGLDRFAVVGRLAEFWGWVDKHAVDGVVDGGTSQAIDDVVVYEGFAEALVQVKWLVITDAGIEIPKHELHNGDSAKERSLKNERQARWRAKKAAESEANPVDEKPSTSPSTREEKRREDIDTPSKARKSKVPADFAPNETGVRLANEAGLNLSREVAQFRDHHTAKGSTMLDWQAAWRTWVGMAVQFGRGGKPANDDPYGLRSAL